MAGGLIAAALAIAYPAHTYFFWKRGRNSEQSQQEKRKKNYNAFWDQGHVDHTGFSHIAPP